MNKLMVIAVLLTLVGCQQEAPKIETVSVESAGKLVSIDRVGTSFNESNKSVVKTTEWNLSVYGNPSGKIGTDTFIVSYKQGVRSAKALCIGVKVITDEHCNKIIGSVH